MLKKIKKNIQNKSRDSKITHFYKLCQNDQKILDVGVFPELLYPNAPSSVNYFLKTFKFESKYYTGLGIEGMVELEKKYPGKRFVEYPGDIFPFSEKQFDWIFCNAVIEHVGDFEAQVLFIKEMVRVSNNVFFTTPNKFFPIDSHTMVFFIHWNDNLFYNWRKKKDRWMPKDALNLLSKKDLKKLLLSANIDNYKIYNNYILGFPIPMTYTIVINS
jgi:hypothetical protein